VTVDGRSSGSGLDEELDDLCSDNAEANDIKAGVVCMLVNISSVLDASDRKEAEPTIQRIAHGMTECIRIVGVMKISRTVEAV
jgi:hypothetical protein